jgi:hypothetical protein
LGSLSARFFESATVRAGIYETAGFGIRFSDSERAETDLPQDALVSHGYEINRRGTIVGWYGIGSRSVAALWDRDGTRTDLPSLTKPKFALRTAENASCFMALG